MSDTASSMRERLFTMRMSEQESARMESIGRHYSINGAAVIRMLLKREHQALATEGLATEDFELLRTLPADGSPMSRPLLIKALSGHDLGPAARWLGASVARLLRKQLITRDGSQFALTQEGKALV